MKRSEQREHIFRLIFRVDFYPVNEIGGQIDLYCDALEDLKDTDRVAIAIRTNLILDKLTDIDEKLTLISEGWKLKRIGKVELAILRLAIFEILFDEDIPNSVAINEAVELAKEYSTEQSARFVNGVLAKIA